MALSYRCLPRGKGGVAADNIWSVVREDFVDKDMEKHARDVGKW